MARILITILVFLLLTAMTLRAGALLYRAPDNLFVLSLSSFFKRLPPVASTGYVIESKGYEFRRSGKRAYLGIEIRRQPSVHSLTDVEGIIRDEARSLPNYRELSCASSNLGGVPCFELHYTFAYEDDPDYPITRHDTAMSLDGRLIIIYVESSGDSTREAERAFKEVLASFRTPLTLPVVRKDAHRTQSPGVPAGTPPPVSFCPFCGKKAVEGALYCPYCGKKLPLRPAAKKEEETKTTAVSVVIPGNPPLTEKTIDVWKMLLEFTARTRLTAAQEKELRDAVIFEYKAGGNRRSEMVSMDQVFSAEKLHRVKDEKADDIRRKLKKRFIEMANAASNSPDGSIFRTVFDSVDTVLVRSDPPLNRQILDGCFELAVFISNLVRQGSYDPVDNPGGAIQRVRFLRRLRNFWTTSDPARRQAFANLLSLWSNLRCAWNNAGPEARTAIALKVKERARYIARRPGVSPGGASRLSDRMMRIMTESPAELVSFGKELDAVFRQTLGR